MMGVKETQDMTHLMFDGYGVKTSVKLGEINLLNQTINLVLFDLGLKPISPAFLLPYDYGLVPLDEGVSSYIFLTGGHFTIHTFPLRGCYFVDLFVQADISAKRLQTILQKYWPSDLKKSRLFDAKRDQDNHSETFDAKSVFGPHVMANVTLNKPLTIEESNRFLETLIHDIDMTPITRAYSVFDQYKNPQFLSTIVMIAESHLSIHVNLKTNTMYFDIFSCKMFDYSGIQKQLAQFGLVNGWHIVPRGQKHDERSSNRKAKNVVSVKTKKALNWWKDAS
jgi:S-adenosylmethionine/arginine decarboxylase-like enzyme